MEQKEPMELIVISDLHLSAGYDEKTGKYSRNEDFFFDDQIGRFLKHLQPPDSSEKKPATKKHLIIAGDMFDFLQVDGDKATELYNDGGAKFIITPKERRYGLGTEEEKTVWKLGVIAKGHDKFFKALGNFVSEKNCISIITGNHDIELYWPKVQDAIKEEIVKQIPCSDADKERIKEDCITFYPWFYYSEKHKAYIEHGNQYDKYNSFQYFLCPLLEPKPEEPQPEEPRPKGPLWLPFGSFFVRYFFNKLETSNPFADNIKPITKYVEWVLREHKLELLKVICRNIPTMYYMFKKRKKFSDADEKELNKRSESDYKEYSEEFNLEINALKENYRLMAQPFTKGMLSTFSFFLGTIFFLIALITFIVILVLHIFDVISPWAFLSSLVAISVPIIKWVYNKYFQKSFFEKNEAKIKEIKQKLGVKTIVFGHTHEPEIRKINENCWYVNTGTWTTIFSEEERIIREAKQFAFVRIKEGGKEPELLRWNDCLEKEERLILFEEKQKKSDKE